MGQKAKENHRHLFIIYKYQQLDMAISVVKYSGNKTVNIRAMTFNEASLNERKHEDICLIYEFTQIILGEMTE